MGFADIPWVPLLWTAMERSAQELIDAIINHFHSNHQDPLVCSLVFPSWFPSSQQHLFYHITFYLTPNIPDSRGAGYVWYSQWLDAVLLRAPHLSNYVQELKLYGGQSTKEQDWIVTDPILTQVLHKHWKLERLEIWCLYWNILTTAVGADSGSIAGKTILAPAPGTPCAWPTDSLPGPWVAFSICERLMVATSIDPRGALCDMVEKSCQLAGRGSTATIWCTCQAWPLEATMTGFIMVEGDWDAARRTGGQCSYPGWELEGADLTEKVDDAVNVINTISSLSLPIHKIS